MGWSYIDPEIVKITLDVPNQDQETRSGIHTTWEYVLFADFLDSKIHDSEPTVDVVKASS